MPKYNIIYVGCFVAELFSSTFDTYLRSKEIQQRQRARTHSLNKDLNGNKATATQPLMSTRNLPRGVERPTCKAENLTSIYELII
jgi:hypothetical protein